MTNPIANLVSPAEYARLTRQQKPRKYHNEPIELDGLKFDSTAEATRYGELRLLEMAGEIRDLRVHTRWPLLVEREKIGEYESDFDYQEKSKSGRIWYPVVEDVKPAVKARSDGKRPYTGRTAVYRLKARLMWACHRIKITEVER